MNTPEAAELFPAGEHLSDELDARGWSQIDFAEVLGRPPQFVSEIISGKREITRESAAQIGAALSTSPELWLNLQDSYLLWKQEQDANINRNLNAVKVRAALRRLAPVPLLVKRGFLSASAPEEQERELLRLFEIERLSDDPAISFVARRSNSDEAVNVIQRAWVACLKASAQGLDAGPYSRLALRQLAGQLTSMARDPEAFVSFQALFAQVGVKIAYVEAFPGGKLDGCALVVEGIPIIGVSGRWKRLDKVLFTILHEAAHIVLGHVRDDDGVIVDDLDAEGDDLEAAADDMAEWWAIPGALSAVPERLTAPWIREQADRLSVHPITLVGRLQNDGLLSWKTTLARNAPTVTEYLERWFAG